MRVHVPTNSAPGIHDECERGGYGALFKGGGERDEKDVCIGALRACDGANSRQVSGTIGG